MSAVRGVVFDKDGTLFDFARTWEAWALAFLDRISDTPGHMRALGNRIGFDTDAARFERNSIVIAGTPAEVAAALAPGLPEMTQNRMLAILNEEAARAPQAEVLPLVPFLSGLRGLGLRLGVATNDAEAPARAHLSAAGALEMFDFIAGSDSGFGGKPAAGQLLAFCEAVALNPSEVIMVGDSTHDLFAGQAAGMRTVGVLTGFATAQTLRPHATVVLDDISQLPRWIAEQP